MQNEWIALLLILIAGPLLFRFLVRQSAVRIQKEYAQLAEDLGLELVVRPPVLMGFVHPDPSATGVYQGFDVTIGSGATGFKGTRQVQTVISLGVQTQSFRLQLTRGGALGLLRQRDAEGLKKFRTGDESFDNLFDLRGNRPAETGRLLGRKELRDQLQATLSDTTGTLYIGNDTIAFVEQGLVSDANRRARARAIVAILISLAQALQVELLKAG